MKVLITDLRNNPRIIHIDGRRFILPSRKEILHEMSRGAYDTLSNFPFIRVRPVEENILEPIKEEPIKEEPIKEEPIKEEPIKEEPIKEEPIKEEPIKEEPTRNNISEVVNSTEVLHESVIVSQEEPVVEEPVVEESNDTVDYSSMTKKELRALLEEKGVDTTGMTKAVMLETLKNMG